MDNNYKKAQEAYDRQEPPEYWDKDDWICDNCKDSNKCLSRCEDLRGWIYEEQITHCINEGKPSYEDDDYWGVPVEDKEDR